MILASALYSGDNDVIQWALDIFDKATLPEDIRPDIRSIVYQTAMKHAVSIETYEKLLHWYSDTNIPGEQITLAGALCGVEDRALFERSLEYITDTQIKLQDARFWIAYALRNRLHKALAWEWVKRNWQWLGSNYGQEKEIDYFLRYCANGFASEEHLRDYTSFFETADIFGSERAREQGKETIRWQSAWKIRDQQLLAEWLKNFTDQN
jgi:aminopeptidase N